MSKKRRADDDSVNEVSQNKRNRSKPQRYDGLNFEPDKRKSCVASNLQQLTSNLKKWNEKSLTLLSYILQWDINLSTEEVAAVVNKEPEQVEELLKLIRKTKWTDSTMKKTLGDNFFLPKDNEHAASETLLDAWFHRRCSQWTVEFWRALCVSLTPASLNNSSEVAVVMKSIALSSDKEYRPIYEYIATALDDPVSTLRSPVNLTPMQCGILLDVLYSLASEVKEHQHLKNYLEERALATLLGDWEVLKMPDPSKESDKRVLDKRVSLQSLNPFNMSKTSVPPVVVSAPTNAAPDTLATPPDAVPLNGELRPIEKMAKMQTGFKTIIIKKKKTKRMAAELRKKHLESRNSKSVDLDHSVSSQRDVPLETDDTDDEEDEDGEDDEEDEED